MTILPDAPLIEVIAEIRWGSIQSESAESVEIHFTEQERDFFPGQFKSVAKDNGFEYLETINKGIPLPHIVSYRFRKEPNTWPCYQIGKGIFTVNQINDGYEWETFKQDFINGLNFLDKSYPSEGLKSIHAMGIELRYQDAFLFEDGECSADFIRNKLNLGFSPPDELFKFDNIKNTPAQNGISFVLQCEKPLGVLIVNIKEGKINGIPGLVVETTVRSNDDNKPDFNLEALSSWIEDAHDVQRHSFQSVINPIAYKK